MKKVLFSIIVALSALPLSITAQDADVQSSETIAQNSPDSIGHLLFHGIPMQGTIDEFGKELKHHFQLKKMMGAERNWIFQGYIYGKECPFQVFYSKKTRTVSRIVVMPKNLEAYIWIDSISQQYGEPFDTELGYVWQRPEGTILLRVIEGYDPALLYLDKQGQATFNEEEKKRR